MYLPETICPNLQLAKLIRELNVRKLLYQEHFVVNYSLLVKSFIKRTFLSLIYNYPHLFSHQITILLLIVVLEILRYQKENDHHIKSCTLFNHNMHLNFSKLK